MTETRSDVIVKLQDHGYGGRVNMPKGKLEELLGQIEVVPDKASRKAIATRLSEENPARDTSAKRGRGDGGLTWNECIAKLRRLGWSGATSYTVPKLREMIATLEAGGTLEAPARGRPRRGTTDDGGTDAAAPGAGELAPA